MDAQIDPFSGGWLDGIERLRNEAVAVRDKVIPFFMDPPDPAVADLEDRVAAQVARYKLEENDRHPTITQAAVTVGEEIEKFRNSRTNMGEIYPFSTLAITMMLEGVALHEMNNAMRQLGQELQGIADVSDIGPAAERFIRSIDPASQEIIERNALKYKLAGGMIDCGNSFLNLDTAWCAALELYVNGQAPQGWWQHLPAPLRSIFSETTWAVIEKFGELGIEHGLPALVPYGSLIFLPVRIGFVIREERVREQRAYQRGDVDELLDLADQLTKATGEAQRLRDALDEIAEAAAGI